MMKHVVRVFLFYVFSIWLTSEWVPGMITPGGWRPMLFAGFMLSMLTFIVTPLLKILFIPINILTFGLLAWTINVVVMYLLTVLVPEIQIQAFVFPGATWAGFVIPRIEVSYLWSLILVSLSISTISGMLHRLSEE